MTEQEWQTSDDPRAMLRLYTSDEMPWPAGTPAPIVRDCKLRLWVEACREACGDAGPHAWRPLDEASPLPALLHFWSGNVPTPASDRAAHLRDLVGNPFRPVTPLWPDCYECHGRGRWAQGRQPDFECPECDGTGKRKGELITPTVLALAQAAYDDRDFALLPLLADALTDAGCDSEELLRHLHGDEQFLCPTMAAHVISFNESLEVVAEGPHRARRWRKMTSPHVRGCWALDLVLGKE